MKRVLPILLFLYVLALHTSIAGMELFGWLLGVFGVVLVVTAKVDAKGFVKTYFSLLLMLLLLLLWVAVSLLSSELLRPFLEQWGFQRWTLLLPLLTLVFVHLWSADFEKRLLQVWAVVALVTAGYAILQFLTGVDFVRPGQGAVNAQDGGIFKAVGFFSMSLSFSYVIGQSAFPMVRSLWARYGAKIGLGAALVMAAGIVSGMSRGAWFAGLLALGFFVACVKRRWIVPMVVITALGLFAASRMNSAIGHKISGLAQGKVDHSSAVRFDLWRSYTRMYLNHPVVGVGIFEGDKVLPVYYKRLKIQQTFKSHAHNNLLQWLAGTGTPGFLLFLGISFSFLFMAWELRQVTPWGWGLLLSHIYWHLGGLTECNFFDGEVNHFIIFGWALTWALHFKKISPTTR